MALPARDPAATPEAHVAQWRASGDPQAFGALFDATAGVLFRVAVTLVPDAATAEDVLQQTYAVALRKLARFEPGRPVMPWLLNVLQKEAAKARRAARRVPDPRRLPVRTSSETEAEGLAGPETEAVRSAIEALEEPYRSAALLRWRYGLEPAEIAHVRGEPPGTIRSLLSRAIEKLKRGSVALPAVWFEGARPPRGLGSVRAAVVGHAAAWSGMAALPLGAVLAGGLVMKKAIAGLAVLLALAGGWWALRPEPEPQAPAPAAVVAPPNPAGVELAGSPTSTRGAKPNANAAADRPAGPSVLGRVVDDAGHAIEGAQVCLYAHDRPGFIEVDSSRPDPTLSIGSSRADGGFDLPMPTVARARMLVLANGYAAGYVESAVPGAPRDVVLRRAGRIHGRVMDAQGRPIAGAKVRWLAILGAFHTERETVSDAAGAYRFDEVPSAGAWPPSGALLVVDAAGYARQNLQPYAELKADVGGLWDGEMNVVLSRGARVEGRVLFDGGGPAGGARVVLWTMDGELHLGGVGVEHPGQAFRLGEAVADGEGRFSFEHAPSRGFHDVRQEITSLVSGRKIGSWLVARAGTSTTAIQEVALVAEGEVVTVEMRVRPAFSVEGRVVDGDGKPLAGMQVWASVLRTGLMVGIPGPLRAEFPTEGDTTGPDGSYRMDGVQVPRPDEPPFGVGAASNRQLLGGQGPDARDRAYRAVPGPYEGVVHAPDLVLAARPFPWGRVRVVREDGAPVPGAALGFMAGYATAITDAEGRARVEWFAIPGADVKLTPQPYFVRAAGFAVQRVAVPMSRTLAEAPEEVVVRLAPGRRLEGRVTAAEGALPEGVQVHVGNGRVPASSQFSWAFPEASRETRETEAFTEYGTFDVAADGSFVATDLPEGPYHVLAVWKRVQSADVLASLTYVTALREDVPTGSKDVALVLRMPPAPVTRDVEVRLVDARTGEPTLRPYATLHAGERHLVGRPMAPGVVRFTEIPIGSHLLLGGAEGYVGQNVTVDTPEEGTPIVLRLVRGSRVSGKLTGSDGKPFRGQVFLEPWDSGGGKLIVPADTYGAFEAWGLPPGRYRVTGLSYVVGLASYWSCAGELQLVDVGPDTPEVSIEGVWVAAGSVRVVSRDPRLVGDDASGFLSEAQARLAKDVALEIVDPAGRTVFRRAGFDTKDPRVEFSGVLPPGAYRARLSMPGEAVRERRFEVAAGERLEVAFPAP